MTASDHRPWLVGHAPWSIRAWLNTVQLLSAVPIVLVSGVVVVVMLVVSVGLSWTVVPAAAIALWLFGQAHRFTRWQRARIAAFCAFEVPEVPQPRADGRLGAWFWAYARLPSTWTQIAYHLLAPLLVGGLGAAVVGTWAAALVFTTAPLWSPWPTWALAVTCLAGLFALLAAPWVAHGAARVDVAVARLLLRPSRSEALSRVVDRLSRSRADAVSAADAERRRIERDLHDGAQQRLVSLAMNLGIARATLGDAPEPVRQALAQAHDEAKTAVKELRDFVRGLNPPILGEQGLDAALSGLAARSAVPVRLQVDVARRVAPAIESVAFFVVSEALTNIVKHAEATLAQVWVGCDADRLLVTVTDNGRGGAEAAAGTGLRGLAQRVSSVDGTFTIDSPVGGPTTLRVELPCE